MRQQAHVIECPAGYIRRSFRNDATLFVTVSKCATSISTLFNRIDGIESLLHAGAVMDKQTLSLLQLAAYINHTLPKADAIAKDSEQIKSLQD